jgi:hypothetical protein
MNKRINYTLNTEIEKKFNSIPIKIDKPNKLDSRPLRLSGRNDTYPNYM